VSISLPRRLPWLLGLSALVILADRISKNWVTAHIRLGGAIPVIPGILRISHWTNEGAAFSLFADSSRPHLVHAGLVGFSGLAAMLVFLLMFRTAGRFNWVSVGLALVFAGAVGNLYDRVVFGSVVDFIEVHIFSYHWPDFNIADSAVVTGACMLLLDAVMPKNREQGSGTEGLRD
jgi:signal peptidase II